MLSYQQLSSYLKYQRYFRINKRKDYLVLTNKTIQNYHVTIYRDQWDDYETVTKLPYYLFHISSNEEKSKCSSYFWVDKHNLKIKTIPKKYFQYGQPDYGYYSSTRQPCQPNEIRPLIELFRLFLKKMRHY